MGKSVALSALILLLLLGLFHFPIPVYRDHTFLHFPAWEVADKSDGAFFPLSNTFLNHGAPLASDPNNLLLYPTAWLLKVSTAQQAYSIHFFGHALLSFWLMAFLLMERLERRKALILAAFWVFSGPFLSSAGSLNLFTTFCWVPGLFLAARKGSVTGQILVLSLMGLAGEPVIGLAAGILVFFYAKDWKKTAMAAAATGLLFIPLFLFLHKAFAFSTKMAGGLTHRTALQASLQPVRLLETVFPFAFGVPGTKAAWASFIEPIRQLLPTLAIAWLFLFLFERNKKNLILVSALLFFALGSFNPVVKFAYEKIPSLALIRFPEKFFLMTAFLFMWQVKDRPLPVRRLHWLGLLIIPAFLMSPMTGILTGLSYLVLMFWVRGSHRWALAAGLASGLLMTFYTVPLSSDLYSFQEPERLLLSQLTGNTVLDQRDPLRIPDDVRHRYRKQREIFGLLIEPPLKEAYYLRRRLLLAPSGMGFDIHYAFAEDVSGAGSIYYAMVTELVPKNKDFLLYLYGVDFLIEDGNKVTEIPLAGHASVLYEGEGRCIPTVREMMIILSTANMKTSSRPLISGDCEERETRQIVSQPLEGKFFEPRGPNKYETQFPSSSILVFNRTYSPLLAGRVDNRPALVRIANGSLVGFVIPPGRHRVELLEQTPLSLIVFLILFYAMLLTVFLTWSLKSLSRRTTKKSA